MTNVMTLSALNLSSPAGRMSMARRVAVSPDTAVTGVADPSFEQHSETRQRAIHRGLSEGLRTLQTFAPDPHKDADLFLSFYNLYGHYAEIAKFTDDLTTDAEQISVALKPFFKRILGDTPDGHSDRIHIWMGEINLNPSVTLILGMTILEFIKNSATSGALASQGGFAGIMCKVNTATDGKTRLALEWQEYGDRVITALSTESQAARLLKCGITDALRGQVEMTCDAPGMRCRFDIPI
jgi:hypothetical protein